MMFGASSASAGAWRLARQALPRPHPKQLAAATTAIRTHMNHGHQDVSSLRTSVPAGPRSAGISIGLDSATSVHNILRLLESSHGPYGMSNMESVWHPQGKLWRHDDQGWNVYPIGEAPPTTTTLQPPSLLSLSFSDHRTALAKVVGMDGLARYLSILQLLEEDMGGGNRPNDGWMIVREVVSAGGENQHSKSFTSVKQTVLDYQAIEHGGGMEDMEHAETIFDRRASLVSVGEDDDNATPSDWSAPAGAFLEIPLQTYLDGVMMQTAHDFTASTHDDIVSIDVLPCGNVALAVVKVGNGAKTHLFEDHLLLGRSHVEPDGQYWRILSKTFSPHAWPQNDGYGSDHDHNHDHDH